MEQLRQLSLVLASADELDVDAASQVATVLTSVAEAAAKHEASAQELHHAVNRRYVKPFMRSSLNRWRDWAAMTRRLASLGEHLADRYVPWWYRCCVACRLCQINRIL